MLDEPTNHLDLESREALEAALEAFPGTLLFVSHNRAILDAVPQRMIAVEEQRLRSTTAPGPTSSGSVMTRLRRPRGRCRRAPSTGEAGEAEAERAEQVEKQVAQLELEVAEVEARLAADWTNLDVLAAHTAAREELQTQLARWEELFEAQSAADSSDG